MPHRPSTFLVLLACLILLAACGSSGASSPDPTATRPLPTEPALAPPLPGSYAALGASETYGVGVVPHTDSYPYLLARALHSRRFVDVGIPGATLSSGYEAELTRALDIRPSLCTVVFGTNDILDGFSRGTFLRDLRDLVGTLREAHVQVLVVGLPDLSYFPRVKRAHIGGVHEIVTSWNAGMRQVAQEEGARFLDLGPYSRELATHPEYITADGLHPSNKAHVRLAQLILAEINRYRMWRGA